MACPKDLKGLHLQFEIVMYFYYCPLCIWDGPWLILCSEPTSLYRFKWQILFYSKYCPQTGASLQVMCVTAQQVFRNTYGNLALLWHLNVWFYMLKLILHELPVAETYNSEATTAVHNALEWPPLPSGQEKEACSLTEQKFGKSDPKEKQDRRPHFTTQLCSCNQSSALESWGSGPANKGSLWFSSTSKRIAPMEHYGEEMPGGTWSKMELLVGRTLSNSWVSGHNAINSHAYF